MSKAKFLNPAVSISGGATIVNPKPLKRYTLFKQPTIATTATQTAVPSPIR